MKKRRIGSLWTKDFTIITIGSLISMLGNALTGFSMSLLILDYTDSPALYAVYVFIYTLPQVVAPLLSGPLLDRFSRKRVIYSLDFFSAGLFLIMSAVLWTGWFSFPVLAMVTFLVGAITGVYTVAYQSYYPLLITEGNFSKAYSVSSTLETLSVVGIPLSALVYNTIGIGPLLLFNGVSFFAAAVMETQLRAPEAYLERPCAAGTTVRRFARDFWDGLSYLRQETGLLAIVAFFFFKNLAAGAAQVITLPYFKGTFSMYGEYYYMLIWGLSMLGKVIGGALHYRIRIPAKAKYAICLVAFIASAVLEGVYLFVPLGIMAIMTFSIGVFDMTSNNIRLAGTQSYVPDERKGRFNGMFTTLAAAGLLMGQLLAGAAETFLDMRLVLALFMGACAAAAVGFVGLNKARLAPILNTEV